MSPHLSKYLNQIDKLNINQLIEQDEEEEEQKNTNDNFDIQITHPSSQLNQLAQIYQMNPHLLSIPHYNNYNNNTLRNNNYPKHRRSKHVQQGRDFDCTCGKSFLSQAALNSHVRTKHPELLLGQEKRGRGRPRKYPKDENFFETTKFESFFHLPKRMGHEGILINIKKVVENVFEFIYKGKYSDKLFSEPDKYQENFILDNLVKNEKLPLKAKSERNCDEVFYEYLNTFIDKTNEKYFSLLLKFILLFRECFDVSKNKNLDEDNKQQFSDKLSPENLPDLCNEFYGEFLDQNDFFGIEDQDDRNEIIDIIQHFCMWLYKNDYTKSKLSLNHL